MTVYGYARVSTLQQDLTLQVEALEKYGIPTENIYTDKKTGANLDRNALNELLSKVTEGDSIIVNKLDRLGRSVSQVTNLIEELTAKGVYIISLTEPVDTSKTDAMSKAMMQLLVMFSEMERSFIMERTKPAIEQAKENGVKFGRPEINKNIYEKAVKEFIEANGTKTVKQIIKEYGKKENGKDVLTEATFFRRLKEYKKREGLL